MYISICDAPIIYCNSYCIKWWYSFRLDVSLRILFVYACAIKQKRQNNYQNSNRENHLKFSFIIFLQLPNLAYALLIQATKH